MVLIPSSVSKSTGNYCLMKHCIVTLPFPILKSKGKYCMVRNHHMCQGYPLATQLK